MGPVELQKEYAANSTWNNVIKLRKQTSIAKTYPIPTFFLWSVPFTTRTIRRISWSHFHICYNTDTQRENKIGISWEMYSYS